MMKEKLWVCFKRRKYNFMRPKLKSKRRCGFNLWKSLSDVCPDCNHCIAEHSHTFWIEGRYQEYRMDCLLCGIGEDSCPIDSGTQRRPAYRSWSNYQLYEVIRFWETKVHFCIKLILVKQLKYKDEKNGLCRAAYAMQYFDFFTLP